MSWWRRLFGKPTEDLAEASEPAERAPVVSAETLPRYIASTLSLTAPAAIERLRAARMRVGDDPDLLVALARRAPDDAQALWMQLSDMPPYVAEAYDALADGALDAATRQAFLERAAAISPTDATRLARCTSDRAPSPPRLALGPWPPLVDRLPARFTPIKPIARGPEGLVIAVSDGQPWTAKGLHADRVDHAQLDAVLTDLAAIAALNLPGLAAVAHLDSAQGLWVRTTGVTTWEFARTADLAPVEAALQTLHAQGKAHGAVGPRNIIIDADGQARLTDWGVSRLRGIEPSVAADRAAFERLVKGG